MFVWSGLFPFGLVISSWLVTNAVLRSNGWNPIIPASCLQSPAREERSHVCLPCQLLGLKVYHLEKTNKQQILRCSDGEATCCGKRCRTQNLARAYVLPLPGSVSTPSHL